MVGGQYGSNSGQRAAATHLRSYFVISGVYVVFIPAPKRLFLIFTTIYALTGGLHSAEKMLGYNFSVSRVAVWVG